MNQNYFVEDFTSDLPSQSSCYSSITSHDSPLCKGAALKHPAPENSVTFHRMATRNHSIEIKVTNDAVSLISDHLPHIQNMDGDNIKEDADAKSHLPKARNDNERKCLAHSYLPLNDTYFFEAFILKVHSSGEEDFLQMTQHSILETQSIMGTRDVSASSQNRFGSDGTMEKKKEETSPSDDLQSSKNYVHNQFCLVLRGLLPLEENSENQTTKTRNTENLSDDKATLEERKKESNKRSTTGTDHKREKHYNFNKVVPLSFRPLLVKLCSMGNTSELCKIPIGLFLVDGATLIFYKIEKDLSENSCVKGHFPPLKEISLTTTDVDESENLVQEDAFTSMLLQNSSPVFLAKDINPLQFASTVLTIDTVQVNDTLKNENVTYVAAGCQDGTIRIISISALLFDDDLNNQHSHIHRCRRKMDAIKFNVMAVTENRVDGPALVTKFSRSSETCLDLLIGSACGFACLFRKRLECEETFHGPHMIVEGLWNGKTNDEDSVLQVLTFQQSSNSKVNLICIGTLSGRLLLFKDFSKTNQSPKPCNSMTVQEHLPRFSCIWHVSLYHAIHGLALRFNNYRLPVLLVVTQKTFHKFNTNIDCFVDIAEVRINNLIERIVQKFERVETGRDESIGT